MMQMVRLSKALNNDQHAALASKVRDQLAEFREYVPVVLALCNPGMRGRHWEGLSAAAGFKVAPGDDLVLNKLLQGGILHHMDALQDISDSASRELALERQLDRMMAEWAGVMLEVLPWKNTGARAPPVAARGGPWLLLLERVCGGGGHHAPQQGTQKTLHLPAQRGGVAPCT